MITPDLKTKVNPRELQTLAVNESHLWYKLQILVKTLFGNLILLALIPYFLNIFPLFSVFVFWLLLLFANIAFLVWMFCYQSFQPKKYEIACKQGIWKITEMGKLHYARLIPHITLWQLIIIIRLYSPAQKRQFKLFILKDSLSPADMASLRRWLISEFN